MNCYCCDRGIRSARKVKLRPWRTYDLRLGGPDSPAYKAYCEEMTFRWAVICQACYSALDNASGRAEVGGIPSTSRGHPGATRRRRSTRTSTGSSG